MSIRNIFELLLFWYLNSFLSQCYLALIEYFPVYKMCSIELFLEIGGLGFMDYFLGQRKQRVLEFKRLAPNCQNSVFLLAQGEGSYSCHVLPLSDVLACMTASLGSEDAACSSHMSSEHSASQRPEQVTMSRNSEQFRGHSPRHMQCWMNPPGGFLQLCLEQLESTGTCAGFQLVGSLSYEVQIQHCSYI